MFQRTSFSGLILFHFKRKLLNEKCQLANLIWLVLGCCDVVVNMPAHKARDIPNFYWHADMLTCICNHMLLGVVDGALSRYCMAGDLLWSNMHACLLSAKNIIPISKYGEVEVRVVLMWHFMDDFFIKYI